MLQALQSLLANPHVQMEPYLHQLMPAVLTCLVGKKLGVSATPMMPCEDINGTAGRARSQNCMLLIILQQAVQLAAAVSRRSKQLSWRHAIVVASHNCCGVTHRGAVSRT